MRAWREVPVLAWVPAGRPPRGGWPAVIALHGYGMDEAFFARVIRLRFPRAPWAWIVPRGPWRVFSRPGQVGYAWLVGSKEHPDHEGMAGTERLLSDALKVASKTLPINPRWAALMGFSQGGFAAGVAALRSPRHWKGAAVLGGYINPLMVPGGLASGRGANLAFLHGRQDADVPMERARTSVRLLAEDGIPATMHTYPGGHKLSRAMAKGAEGVLREALSLSRVD